MAQTFSTQTEYRAFPNQLPTELFAFRRRAWCHSHRRDRGEGIGVLWSLCSGASYVCQCLWKPSLQEFTAVRHLTLPGRGNSLTGILQVFLWSWVLSVWFVSHLPHKHRSAGSVPGDAPVVSRPAFSSEGLTRQPQMLQGGCTNM